MIKYENAKNFFEQLTAEDVARYSDYWNSVSPKDDYQRFQRYLFAFCSVHTNFAGNISAYQAIKDYDKWAGKPDELRDRLIASRAGLYNNRTKFITDFCNIYWKNPKDFYFTCKKNHVSKRDEIASKITGLGLAKVSFALEMIHPTFARVVCGDVHQLRFYGMEDLNYSSGAGKSLYRKMENHWVVRSLNAGASPYIARCVFWDKLQEKPDSRYWSYVFES